ncbi:MAG TPA: ATP-binding protein [Rhizomicrobium sp.]|jgi:two-component system phosphate regulon sensor histidine kinase PhoR
MKDRLQWRVVRNWLWPFACGLAAAGAVLSWNGSVLPSVFWISAMITAVFAAIAGNRAWQQHAINAAAPAVANPLPALAREMFETLPDPLLMLDETGRAVFANAAMRAVIGNDYERKSLSVLLRVAAIQQAVEVVNPGEVPAMIEFATHVPIERHFQAYVSRSATAPLTLILLHDLTAIKRTEQMRADFVANASHELRTPLAAVSGFIDTLRGHARDDEQAREKFLGIMSVEAARMRRLIEDLLSLTRIELNEHVPPSVRVQLEGVVRSAAAALQPLAQTENVTIEITAGPDLPVILGDRDELTQLFQNLMHNAIKYGRANGHVRVTLSATPGAITIAVRDEGEGIPRDAIPRLTERFYRVDVKRSREKGGTGLGLAIVKHIVNRHHGRLQIESEAGSGSTFTVIFPAFAPADAAVT